MRGRAAWLFFIDESGHDHKAMPYEVRGGFAIHVSRLWPFVQDMQRLEADCFGSRQHAYRKEIKGSTPIDRKRFGLAGQGEQIRDGDRQRLCRSFLTKSREHRAPRRDEFTAYGQACLLMARETFGLLRKHKAVVMASAIPRGVVKPADYQLDDFLRKGVVFLLERFFYFLEREKEHGVLVMDETDKQEDRRFVARLERYFSNTFTGRYRTAWIVPTPFFVSSDMTSAVQAADLCIYCINWGFRLPRLGMNADRRDEIATMFRKNLADLQFRGQGYRDGRVFSTYGIVYVPDPYEARATQ